MKNRQAMSTTSTSKTGKIVQQWKDYLVNAETWIIKTNTVIESHFKSGTSIQQIEELIVKIDKIASDIHIYLLKFNNNSNFNSMIAPCEESLLKFCMLSYELHLVLADKYRMIKDMAKAYAALAAANKIRNQYTCYTRRDSYYNKMEIIILNEYKKNPDEKLAVLFAMIKEYEKAQSEKNASNRTIMYENIYKQALKTNYLFYQYRAALKLCILGGEILKNYINLPEISVKDAMTFSQTLGKYYCRVAGLDSYLNTITNLEASFFVNGLHSLAFIVYKAVRAAPLEDVTHHEFQLKLLLADARHYQKSARKILNRFEYIPKTHKDLEVKINLLILELDTMIMVKPGRPRSNSMGVYLDAIETSSRRVKISEKIDETDTIRGRKRANSNGTYPIRFFKLIPRDQGSFLSFPMKPAEYLNIKKGINMELSRYTRFKR